MQRVVVQHPWQRLGMDLLGPLPRTARNNRYILVIMDYYSKWVEAYPVEKADVATVADILIREVVCRFGTPEVIHTDQGTHFEANLLKKVLDRLGIEKTRTTPYHPASDGMVERFNRTLERMFRATLQRPQGEWDVATPFLTAAYRATPHASTGLTPNRVMLGREVSLPIDVAYGLPGAGQGE